MTKGVDNKEVPIVFFDGSCQLCAKSVQLIMKHERAAELKYAPLYGNTYSKYVGPNTDPAIPESFLVFHEGRFLRESSAFFELTAYLKKPLSTLAIFRFLPRFITDVMYRLIANNRYRLFWKVKEECIIYPDNQRFLD